MSISRRWIHRVLVGVLLAGITVAAVADEPYYLLTGDLQFQLSKITNKKVAVVIVIDEYGSTDYLFPTKPVYGKILPSKNEVGYLINLDSIGIAVTSKSPNCIWITGGGTKYLWCP